MDYRLLLPSAVVWAVTAIGLVAPVGVTVGLAVTGGVVTTVAAAVCLRVPAAWQVLGLVVVAAGLMGVCATSLALRQDARTDHPLASVSGKTTLAMTLQGDPTIIGSPRHGRVRVVVEVEQIGTRGVRPVRAELTGSSEVWTGLLPGQRVSAVASVKPAPERTLLVARLTAGAPRLVGSPPTYQRVAGAIRERLQLTGARALGPEASGLLPGLVLGDESRLDEDLREDFRAAGLSHLTAVSGANFAIVCGAAILIVGGLGVPPRATAIIGLVVIVGFAILVRPSPSVLRAALMGAIGVFAVFFSRKSQSFPALGAAVVGGLLWWPELALQPGFALSVAATCAIVLWAPRLRDRLLAKRVPAGLAEVLAMAITAQVVTAPIVVLVTGQLSIVGLVANVLVAPVVAIISVVGTVAALVGALGPPDGVGAGAAELLLRALGPEMWWMIACARTFGRLSWASVDVPLPLG